jgi:hypothetical protein
VNPVFASGWVAAVALTLIALVVVVAIVSVATSERTETDSISVPMPFSVSVTAVRWAAPTSCFTVENTSVGPSHLALGASFAVSTNLTPTDECRGFAVSAVTSASAGFEVLYSTAPVNGSLGEMRVLPLSAEVLLGSSAAQSGVLVLDLNVSEVL